MRRIKFRLVEGSRHLPPPRRATCLNGGTFSPRVWLTMVRERGNPWSGVRLPRGPRLDKPIAECWRCGDTVTGRLPGHSLSRSGTVLGIVPLCPTCVGAIPHLDPDPLTIPS